MKKTSYLIKLSNQGIQMCKTSLENRTILLNTIIRCTAKKTLKRTFKIAFNQLFSYSMITMN